MIYKYHYKMNYVMFTEYRNMFWLRGYGDTVRSIDSLFKLFTDVNIGSNIEIKLDYITNTPIFEIPILLRKHIIDDRYLDHTLYVNYDRDDFELFVNSVINDKIKSGGKLIVADMRESKVTIAVLTVDNDGNVSEREDSEHVITDRCCRDYLVEKGFIEKVSYRGAEYYEMSLFVEKNISLRRYLAKVFFNPDLSIVEHF